MSKSSTLFLSAALLFLVASSITSCIMDTKKTAVQESFEPSNLVIDLPDITKKGTLTVLTENSSTSYFIYKGKKMGFEYEILKLFAEDIGVNLEIKIVNNLDSLIEKLEQGEGDLIACNYTITNERSKILDFSEPILETHQVLIQRKPDGWENMTKEELSTKMITKATQLGQKEVHVWKNSSYYQRLQHLQEEIGDSIRIQGLEGNVSVEELIEMVSSGEIDYTVTENNAAYVNTQFFDNIDTELSLSVKQRIAFGLRKSSTLLSKRLDDWLREFKQNPAYDFIYQKYFGMPHISKQRNKNHPKDNGKYISKYDAQFKKASKMSGWDWRLIASVAYQESKFNPNALSFGGAYGMMQFMPNTGPHYGVFPDTPPAMQIMGGAKKLMADEKFWKAVPDRFQRKKFALASYNAGRGHIQDAVRLAEKYGVNHRKWDGCVEKMLLNLSKRKFHQDEVVRNGMLRGTTTYKYVHEVTERYMKWVTIYNEN